MTELTSLDAWEACREASKAHPLLVFKHSTACPISADAYRNVETYMKAAGESSPPIYLVKVIESRPVSNQIADQLKVQHKSPQLILLKDGSAIWLSSHYGINVEAIREALASRLSD